MKIFETKADLVAASLTAGQLTSTKGYTTAGDGGGATYLIKTAVDFGGTPDETIDHTLANGNVAVFQAYTNQVKGDRGQRLSLVGCVIRNTGAGWGYLDDTGHIPIGFNGTPEVLVAPEDFKLRLPIDGSGSKVGSLVCAPDETFATKGLTVGASVGVNEAILQCSMPLKFRTYGTGAVGDVPSYFGSRVSITPLGDGTGYTATVPNLQGAATSQIVATTRGTDERSTDIRVNVVNNTTLEVRSYAPVSGEIRFVSGTTFAVDTDIAGVTATWSVDTLTISHPTMGATEQAVAFARFFNGHNPRLVSSSNTGFSMKFYDDSGVLQTSPNSAYKFTFTRSASLPATMPSTQAVYIDCGPALLYWDDISDANGNFWVYGAMEI